jgi:hypothetical protein
MMTLEHLYGFFLVDDINDISPEDGDSLRELLAECYSFCHLVSEFYYSPRPMLGYFFGYAAEPTANYYSMRKHFLKLDFMGITFPQMKVSEQCVVMLERKASILGLTHIPFVEPVLPEPVFVAMEEEQVVSALTEVVKTAAVLADPIVPGDTAIHVVTLCKEVEQFSTLIKLEEFDKIGPDIVDAGLAVIVENGYSSKASHEINQEKFLKFYLSKHKVKLKDLDWDQIDKIECEVFEYNGKYFPKFRQKFETIFTQVFELLRLDPVPLDEIDFGSIVNCRNVCKEPDKCHLYIDCGS